MDPFERFRAENPGWGERRDEYPARSWRYGCPVCFGVKSLCEGEPCPDCEQRG